MTECFLIREKVLGLSHPDTLNLCNSIAKAYDMVGNHAKAQEYMDKIVYTKN